MGKFQIMTPGGYEVEVVANNADAALKKAKANYTTLPRIIFKNGTTRVFEKDGFKYLVSPNFSTQDPQKIKMAMDGMTGAEISTQNENESLIAQYPFLSRLNEFVRGTPGVGSMADEVVGMFAGDDAKSGMRALSNAMQTQRPGQTTSLNLAGAVAATPGMIAALPEAAMAQVITKGPMYARALKAAAAGAPVGAIEGGIYGAGEGTDANSRIDEAQTGSAIGATFGTILGAATPYAARGFENLIGMFRRSDIGKIASDLGVSKDAAKVIKNTFDQGGDIESAQAALVKAGDEAMLADAGLAAQALLDAAANAGGRAGQITRSAMQDRVARSSQKVISALNKALGEANDPEALRRGIVEGTKAQRQAAYDKAFGQEIDFLSPDGQDLLALLETTPRDVLAKAARNARMSARNSSLPNYSANFEPEIYFPSGSTPAEQAEIDEIGQFFKEYRRASRGMKRPFTAMMKNLGGIDPNGKAADELRARGVTSQTHPALYRAGGMKEVDNLEAAKFPENMRFGSSDDTYANVEDIYDALVDEGAGRAIASSDDLLDSQNFDELERLLPEYEARSAALRNSRNGLTAPRETPSNAYPVQTVEDVDAIKRALNEIERTNDGQGLLGGTTDYGRLAGIRARETKDALKRAVPEYGDALQVASDSIGRTEGVKFGAKLLSPATTRDMVSEFVQRSEPPEIYAAQAGLRGQIDEIIANVRAIPSDPNLDARQALKALSDMSSDAARAKMAMILGDQAPALFKQLDEASQTMTVRASMSANSKTAPRVAGKKAMDEITTPGIAGSLAQGDPINTTKALVQSITGMTNEYSEGQRQRIYESIAKALTQKRGPEARNALAALDQAMQGQGVTEEQTTLIANAIAKVLFASATPTATRSAVEEERQ